MCLFLRFRKENTSCTSRGSVLTLYQSTGWRRSPAFQLPSATLPLSEMETFTCCTCVSFHPFILFYRLVVDLSHPIFNQVHCLGIVVTLTVLRTEILSWLLFPQYAAVVCMRASSWLDLQFLFPLKKFKLCHAPCSYSCLLETES